MLREVEDATSIEDATSTDDSAPALFEHPADMITQRVAGETFGL
jgi:hypothetical protein